MSVIVCVCVFVCVCVCVCVCICTTHACTRTLSPSLSPSLTNTTHTHLLFVDAMRAGTVMTCHKFSKVRALVYYLYKTHYIEHF